MMPGWNQMRQPNPQVPMNRNPNMMGSGNMMMGGGNPMMGNFNMNQPYQMPGGQMMYQQPYMQGPMYHQPMMNSYNNMTNSQMNQQPMPPQAPLPNSAPDQPPPPAPCEPPPNSSAPLPPVEEKKSLSQPPPPPNSAKEWWKSELENLSGSSREDLEQLTMADWFLNMGTSQQIEYWQHKMQLKSKQEEQAKSVSQNTPQSYNSGIKKSSDNSKISSLAEEAGEKSSKSESTANLDDDVAPEWDKSSGEDPHDALIRYQNQLKKLKEQAEVFEKQYNDWRKQFDEWKEKHRNHPNKAQFNQYEKQWVAWQKQMLEQKKQNESNKERLLENIKKIEQTIEEEKRQREKAEQMKYQQTQNFDSASAKNPYQASGQTANQPFTYPQGQHQMMNTNQPNMWGNQNRPQQQAGNFGNSQSDFNRNYSMPGYNQARPNEPMFMGGNAPMQNAMHQQGYGFGNQQQQPPNQPRMQNFGPPRPPMHEMQSQDGNQGGSNLAKNNKRNEYDSRGNLIGPTGVSQQRPPQHSNIAQQQRFPNNFQQDAPNRYPNYSQGNNFGAKDQGMSRFPGNSQQTNSFRGNNDQQSQHVDSQLKPRFSGDSQTSPRHSSNFEHRPRFPAETQHRAQHPGASPQRHSFPNDLDGSQTEKTFSEHSESKFSSDAQQNDLNYPSHGDVSEDSASGDFHNKPRFPGDFHQRQRFPGHLQHRQRFPGDMSQRQRFPIPGDSQQRQRFSGDFQQRQRFPGDFQQRSRFSGDAQQRQRFPGELHQRQRFPGDSQQRPRFPGGSQRPRFLGDAQQRPRFPEDPDQRPRFSGDSQQRPRFPGEAHQRQRFPGGPQQRPRFPDDSQQRPRFPGESHQRPRFPADSQQRPRFPGDSQQRQRFPGESGHTLPSPDSLQARPRFPGEMRNDPSLENHGLLPKDAKDEQQKSEPAKAETKLDHSQIESEFAMDEDYGEWESRQAGRKSSGTTFPAAEVDSYKDDDAVVFVDGESLDDYIKKEDHIEKPPTADRFDTRGGPRMRGSGPRFRGRGGPPPNANFPQPRMPRGGLRPRFPEQGPPRPPRHSFPPRYRHPIEPQHFGDDGREDWHEPPYDKRSKDASEVKDAFQGDINMNAACKLAESNPLFTEENMKKLQAQLKLITKQNKEKAEMEAATSDVVQDSISDPMDKGKILEKARNVSSTDLKNILAAVKTTSGNKGGRREGVEGGIASRSIDGDGSRPFDGKGMNVGKRADDVDPLLDSLEALVAVGALENDEILQEYLRADPLLEQELYMRAMQDRELMVEAKRISGRPDWHEERPPRQPPLGGYNELDQPPNWHEGGRRGSFDKFPRLESPPVQDYVYPPRDDSRRAPREPHFRDRSRDGIPPFGPDGRAGRGRSPPRDLRDAAERDLERQSLERRHQAVSRDLESVKQRRETLDSVFVYDERDEERMHREDSLERLRVRETELLDYEQEILNRENALREALRMYSPSRKRPLEDDRLEDPYSRRGPPDGSRRGPPDDFRRGPPDSMRRGPPDDFRRGPPDSLRRGPPDGLRRGPPEDMRRGPPDARDSNRPGFPPRDRFGNGSPPRGRGSPGREFPGDRFRSADNIPPREFRDERDRPPGRRRTPSPRREEMRRRDRGRSPPRRRSPPRKLKRSRSRSPPRGTRDEVGRELPYRGRPLPGHAPSPRMNDAPSRRGDAEKRPPMKGDDAHSPADQQRRANTPPRRGSPLIKPTGRPVTFSDLQEPPKPEIAAPPQPLRTNIEDIMNMPGRLKRPPKIVIILRGLPGCGKTHIAKKIRDKEGTFKVSPRMLGLDDYFMTEVEKQVKDPDTGKTTKKRVFEYEYEEEMEESYRGNLVRSFKKTLEDGYFTFVIIDAINDKLEHFKECYSSAKQNGFEVYVADIDIDVHECARRNVHNRSLEDIQKLKSGWEKTPDDMNKLDLRQLIQDSSIQEVEMGDITDSDEEKGSKAEPETKKDQEDSATSSQEVVVPKSKWETDAAATQLDKLDGIHKKKTVKQSMEDFLSVTDDYNARKSAPGKKRVRWADINERQTQQRMRDVGFVVGQTDWSRMMDDSHATQALNRTKFI